MPFVVQNAPPVQYFQIVAMRRAESHQLIEQVRHDVLIYVFLIQQIF